MPPDYSEIEQVFTQRVPPVSVEIAHDRARRVVMVQMEEVLRGDAWATFEALVRALREEAVALYEANRDLLADGDVVGDDLLRAKLAVREARGRRDALTEVLAIPALAREEKP